MSRCSRSARATPGPATSRASGGGSGSRSSARPSTRLEPRRPPLRPRRREGRPRAPRRAGSGLGDVAYEPERDEPLFHPGRTARARDRGTGWRRIVGELHPDIVDAWELRTTDRVIVAEVALEGLAAGRLAPERAPCGRPLPRGRPRPRDRRPRGDRARPPSRPSSAPTPGSCSSGVALFDIYRGVPARREREEPRLPAPARCRRSDAHRARGRGGGRPPSSRRCPPSRAASAPDAGDRTIARRRARTGSRAPGCRNPLRGPFGRCYPSPGSPAERGTRPPSHEGSSLDIRRNADVDQRRRHPRHPVPVRDVHPGLRPGRHPPAHRHPVDHVLVLPRAPAQRLLAGRLPEPELDAVPAASTR